MMMLFITAIPIANIALLQLPRKQVYIMGSSFQSRQPIVLISFSQCTSLITLFHQTECFAAKLNNHIRMSSPGTMYAMMLA